MAWGTIEKLKRSKEQRNLFLALMSTYRIDSVGTIVFEPGWNDKRLATDDPHATAQSFYGLLTVEQAMTVDKMLGAQYSLALVNADTHARWVESKLAMVDLRTFYVACCSEVYGTRREPYWGHAVAPLDAIRAMLSCYTRKEQQRLRGKISERVYRIRHREKNNNQAYNF